MNIQEKLEKILRFYQSNFDIERDYKIGNHIKENKTYENKIFTAYGHFNADNSKYVLVKEAKLWEANCQEHTFFDTLENIEGEEGEKYLKDLDKLIKEVIEPEFVRHGEKYPPKNHMYSYLTFIIFVDGILPDSFVKAVKKYHYYKNYLLTVRGYSEVHLLAASMTDKTIATNSAGKELKKLYQELLK